MNKFLMKKAIQAQFKVRAIATNTMAKLKEKDGLSEFVAVLLLIAIALVVAIVIFLPNIKEFFNNLFGKFNTTTDQLFNFK